MDRKRAAVATLTVAVLSATPTMAGCGRGEDQPAATQTDAPGVAAAKSSVVKIASESPDCVMEGSGFVAAPNRVITPAQIVAGGEDVSVDLDGRTFDAHVVSFDPKRDLAILDVPNLPATPLSFATRRRRPEATRSCSATQTTVTSRRSRPRSARSSP